MNNSIINLLIKLKNFSLLQRETVQIAKNTQYFSILKILYNKGFIQSFKLIDNKNFIITLRYYYSKPIFKDFKIISKPSLSQYICLKDLYKLEDKKFVFFLSTTQGLLTSIECKKKKLGGKLLFLC